MRRPGFEYERGEFAPAVAGFVLAAIAIVCACSAVYLATVAPGGVLDMLDAEPPSAGALP